MVRQSAKDRERLALLEVFLGAGEAETLVVAQEVGADLVLIADLRARQAGEGAGLRVVGVAGFLLAAKQSGHVPAVVPLLGLLRSRGFHLSKALVEEMTHMAGED